ncbi:52 kDa repressor of the inhibitor of the protein kinase-like [Aphis gossypii]|uniref:52 kDa repressor of the inhibitor of the protein kinase-like n=1 Tax=Aphis gossypii TaxID=80765 RepID=UPI002158DBE4|nr:52 kDa repressor of the inhibitor of the protein kinase-like [Aphis gossypii]
MTDNKRKNSGSISSWVKKRTSVTQVHSSPDLTNKNEQPPINEHTNTPFSTTISIRNDIGDYVEKGSQTDHVKARFLESTNVPDNNCQYPFSLHNKQRKDKNVTLKSLVTVPLNKYAKILGETGDLSKHSKCLYHINATQKANDFLTCYKNPAKEIINVINNTRLNQVIENRARLKPIVESVIFLGRQNIPLRGHRDQGSLIGNEHTENSLSVVNEGNFRELLRFRILSGDTVLKNHLETTSAKATYISHTSQEEIIQCCKEEILFQIMENIRESQYFSIIFDETTDISHISQMSLSLEILTKKIKFMNDPKLTGEVLGNTVVNVLKDMSLNLDDCIGIATDGCAVMTSVIRGAVQHIQKSCVNAVHSPCSNHALNLSISKSSNVQLTLNDKRTNCDVHFEKIFEESKNVMIELDVEMKQPRIVKKQNQRCNTPANSIEEYYRRILFIPIIDNVLEDIKHRFLDEKNKTIFLLMQLILSNTIKMSSETSDEIMKTVGDQYTFLDLNTLMFRGELELWKTKWTTQKNEGLNIPNEVFSAFDECSDTFFPSIKKLLLVLGTLSVSVATAERSFSTLRSQM